MSKSHANILALAYATRAAAQSAAGDQEVLLGDALRVSQAHDARFARGEAQEACIDDGGAAPPNGHPAALHVQSGLMPFTTVQGPLPEDLVAELMHEDASAARALCDSVYANVMNAWLEGALGMRIGAALAAEPQNSRESAAAARVPQKSWSTRLSHLVAAGRAPSPKARQLLRVMGNTRPSATDLVQLVGTLWRDAGLPQVPIEIEPFAGGMQKLPREQRFALGTSALGHDSVLGARMPAAASCCEVVLGPLERTTLAALDTHATLRDELSTVLCAVVPATQNVRVVLLLAAEADAPLRLAPDNGAAQSPQGLGRRSWLATQKAHSRLTWIDLRGQTDAPQMRSKEVPCKYLSKPKSQPLFSC